MATARHKRTGAEIALIALALGLSVVFFGLPLATILVGALKAGLAAWGAQIVKPDTLHAVWLTILTALVCVPLNVAFGIMAAWLIARFRFPGRRILLALIELPASMSPIVAGMTFLFLYGAQGLFGPFLEGHGLKIMFSVPAIFLVSFAVTLPFVMREVLPVMEHLGSDDEQAALTLGAGGWTTFRRVTLPNIRWALFYGVVLCNARVMGEFGAVSVVSGAIRGRTNTLPLQIELLFNDYNPLGAFAAATLLTAIAVITLLAKFGLELTGTIRRHPA